MHSEGLCEGLNRSKGLNKCTPGRAVHILKCSGGVKAGAKGCGVSVGVQIYSSVCRRGPGCGTASAGVHFGPPALSWGGRFSIRPGSHSPKPGKGLRIFKLLPLPGLQCLPAAWKRVSQEQGEGLPVVPSPSPGQLAQLRPVEPGERQQSQEALPEYKGFYSRRDQQPSKCLRGCCELFMGSDRV